VHATGISPAAASAHVLPWSRDVKQPGVPVESADYAFAFRLLEPAPGTPRVLLVLLHGVGGDETQLAELGASLAEDVLVVLPRGQRSISGGMLGWFRVGLGDDGPQVVEDEAEEARDKLVEFVAQLQQRFAIPPARTVLAGFSQGGVLAAAAALTAPHRVAGFAVLCGRILPEIEPLLPPRERLRHLQALLIHGRDDATLPVDWATRAAQWLDRLGISHALLLQDAGHELTQGMRRDFRGWFEAVDRRWSR
jgi:phospholipase/carboxylesterase